MRRRDGWGGDSTRRGSFFFFANDLVHPVLQTALFIMNCTCRTIALTIFLRNIARLNIPGAVTSAPLRQSRAGLSCLLRVGPAGRGLHCSGRRNGVTQAALGSSSEYTIQRLQDGEQKVSGDRDSVNPSSTKVVIEEGSSSKTHALRPKRRKSSDTKAAKKQTNNRERKPKPRATPALAEKVDGDKDGDTDDKPQREDWQIQKAALKEKFPGGWNPRKKLSPDALEGIRALNAQFPDVYTTEALAKRFEVSPEAIRRILRSKWKPSPEEEEERQERWFNRGKQVWSRWAELGKKPPRRWRQEGIRRQPRSESKVRTQSQGKRHRLRAKALLSESFV